ncbi:hypothetical protein EVAR_20758_1 [Eumeta japonica]|uniref:Uncharacterized protein n=1 Tax=Eumeta variegata TaxID=151549 RepID=A0A4C1VCP1_EUMVA|nr:hypothetical protein EVAR_20758_1 [Eumeta japonica]
MSKAGGACGPARARAEHLSVHERPLAESSKSVWLAEGISRVRAQLLLIPFTFKIFVSKRIIIALETQMGTDSAGQRARYGRCAHLMSNEERFIILDAKPVEVRLLDSLHASATGRGDTALTERAQRWSLWRARRVKGWSNLVTGATRGKSKCYGAAAARPRPAPAHPTPPRLEWLKTIPAGCTRIIRECRRTTSKNFM